MFSFAEYPMSFPHLYLLIALLLLLSFNPSLSQELPVGPSTVHLVGESRLVRELQPGLKSLQSLFCWDGGGYVRGFLQSPAHAMLGEDRQVLVARSCK